MKEMNKKFRGQLKQFRLRMKADATDQYKKLTDVKREIRRY